MSPIFASLFLYACVSLSSADMPLNMEACDIGDVIENECSKCTCTTRNVYECKQKTCRKTKVDPLNRAQWGGVSCQPHKIYHQLSTICICRADGSWPHESCYSTFRALPASKIQKKKCTGNKYAIIDCNICMCNERGQIETERCTQNDCDEEDTQDDRRRKTRNSHVFGNCMAHNWYSLAPCQYCYCLTNNKLMCNTGSNNVKGIQLGSYNFSLCGPEFLNEALELVPQDKRGVNIMRMSEEPTVSTPKATAKSIQKAFEFEDLFGKADLEMMQQKEKQSIADQEDYSSDTNEKSEKNTKTTTTKPTIPIEIHMPRERTQQPYDEIDGNYSDDKNDNPAESDKDDSEYDKDNEMKVDPIKPTKKVAPLRKGRSDAEAEDADTGGFDLGAAIKKNLPYMLSKVFNVRKTVVLDSQTKCEPGSQVTVACNICHCMKNGKMLCTDKKCD